MADDIINENIENQETNTNEEAVSGLSETQAEPSFLNKLGNMLTGNKPQEESEQVEEQVEEPTSEEVSETEVIDETPSSESSEEVDEGDYEEIDPEQIEAARSQGWSDEQIVNIAETNPEALEAITRLHRVVKESLSPTLPAEETTEESQATDVVEPYKLDEQLLEKLAEDGVDNPAIEIIKSLAKQLNTVTDKLNKVDIGMKDIEEDSATIEQNNMILSANKAFDEAAAALPVLGKTDELPKLPDGTYDERSKAFQARAKIFDVASMFHSKGNVSWPGAVQEAMNWFRGQERESVIKQKVIKDIKAQEKRVTPRRVGKSVVKTYESEEEEKEDIVKTAMKNAGVQMPD